MEQLLIYIPEKSHRQTYVFNFVFRGVLGIDYQETGDFSFFSNSQLPKLMYSDERLNVEGIYIKNNGFLYEKGMCKTNCDFTIGCKSDAPFTIQNTDVFAATFFLITRYEEYFATEKDQYQRFSGKQSVAYQYGFLKRPIVDEWAFSILEELLKKYPSLSYKKRSYQFIPTLDIDMPYYYRSEGIFRRILKKAKKLIEGEFKYIFRDPYDVYEQVKKWDVQFQINTIYFLLMGNKHQFDNPHHKNKQPLRALIKTLALSNRVGVHPSYYSNNHTSQIATEKNELENYLGKKVELSRQHYLKLTFPDTYRSLLANGIKEDYTMIYADEPGFRASTCTPFYWYDLENDKVTDLKIYPTAVMDQTLKRYQQLNREEALKEVWNLIENVRKVNGTLITLWHNESVSDFGGWKGWKNMYIQMLEMATP
ncbi:polysaccharide deacetylase family protein [Pseudopedobacter beijingensis]|uniref:Polysaccharide deacetylase family protein n=1 Tax=Pseudopedobacter beijingensis TaxID=1207056 RepID=A0ABW4IAN4_9SPHI